MLHPCIYTDIGFSQLSCIPLINSFQLHPCIPEMLLFNVNRAGLLHPCISEMLLFNSPQSPPSIVVESNYIPTSLRYRSSTLPTRYRFFSRKSGVLANYWSTYKIKNILFLF